MSDLGQAALGAAAVVAAILVNTAAIPSDPPALLALAVASIVGGYSLGEALGKMLDSLGVPPRIRNLGGELLSWQQLGGLVLGGVGAVAYVAVLALAIL